jgi:hypothetical protein
VRGPKNRAVANSGSSSGIRRSPVPASPSVGWDELMEGTVQDIASQISPRIVNGGRRNLRLVMAFRVRWRNVGKVTFASQRTPHERRVLSVE